MKNRMSVMNAAFATVLAGCVFATTHANAQDAQVDATIQARAPLRATLMPTVSVDATAATSESNPATMRVARTQPLQVTLLPTVYVSAKTEPEIAATLLPTVRVTARADANSHDVVRIVDNDGAVSALPTVDAAPSRREPPAMRVGSMPR